MTVLNQSVGDVAKNTLGAKEGSFTGQAQSSEHQRTAGWSEQGLV
jgi:hypothetical protein